MLYKVGQNYLNLDEVESVIADKSGDPKFPYALTINMKSGHNVTRWYASEAVRDSTAVVLLAPLALYMLFTKEIVIV